MKSVFILTTIISLFGHPTFAQNWQNITPSGTNSIPQAHFFNADVGYALGVVDNQYFFGFTLDGGKSWENQNNNPWAGIVFFLNPDTALLLRSQNSYPPKLYRTYDGGKTIDSIYSFTEDGAQAFSQIYSNSKNELFVRYRAVRQDSSKSGLYKSKDYGSSWYKVSSQPIRWLSFVNDTLGYGFKRDNSPIENTRTMRTTDGGETWQEISYAPSNIQEIKFTSPDTGYGYINLPLQGDPSSELGMHRTTDSGLTWYKKINGLPTDMAIEGFDFANSNVGYLIVHQRGIYKTENAGNTWVQIWDQYPCFLKTIQVIDEATVFVWSDPGSANATCLYKTINGGGTVSVAEKTPAHAIKVYPNPAKEELIVELPQTKGMAEAVLYSLTGQIVLQKIFTNSGINKMPLTNLRQGLYLLRVTTASGEVYFEKVVVAR